MKPGGLGWEGVDFALTLDLGRPIAAREITISTLSDAGSWILHPVGVACSVSAAGKPRPEKSKYLAIKPFFWINRGRYAG